LLVPRLCLGTQIRRLCLLFFSPIDEAEPLDISSQAEPRNQLKCEVAHISIPLA